MSRSQAAADKPDVLSGYFDYSSSDDDDVDKDQATAIAVATATYDPCLFARTDFKLNESPSPSAPFR